MNQPQVFAEESSGTVELQVQLEVLAGLVHEVVLHGTKHRTSRAWTIIPLGLELLFYIVQSVRI